MKRDAGPALTSGGKHPGEVLLSDFMIPCGLSAARLALALNVSGPRISEILNARRGITAETALRLSRLLGTTARFWLDLQADYELSLAEEKWGQDIDQQIQPLASTDEMPVMARLGISNSEEQQLEIEAALQQLTGSQKTIYDLLSDEATSFDHLCRISGMNAGELGATLVMLELSKLIKCHPGNCFSRTVTSKQPAVLNSESK